MFCVIQEVSVKKADKGGYVKELKSEYLPIILNREDIGYYWHFYGNEKFERPIKNALLWQRIRTAACAHISRLRG